MTTTPPYPANDGSSPGQSLDHAAAQGLFRMEPGVAERASARCLEAYDRVEAHRARLSDVTALQCGTSSSGRTLGHQLDEKVGGEDGSVARALHDEGRALVAMSEAFRAAGRAAREQDQAASESFTGAARPGSSSAGAGGGAAG